MWDGGGGTVHDGASQFVVSLVIDIDGECGRFSSLARAIAARNRRAVE